MFDPNLLLIAFGFAFIAIWLTMRLGRWKKWYWKSRGGVYGYLPLGFLFLLYAFREQAAELLGDAFNPLSIAVFVLLGALAVWFSLRPPAFIKPAWIRWVEAHPKHVINAMRNAVEEEDNWEEHVLSQEAVNQWAKAVTRKTSKKK